MLHLACLILTQTVYNRKKMMEVRLTHEIDLRQAMRRWPSGVAVVTSGDKNISHGMTVNSFVSISIEPPTVSVTMANNTRTKKLVEELGLFAVNLLAEDQEHMSEVFAGKVGEEGDRFEGLEITTGKTGVPLLMCANAWLECRVIHRYELPNSTLYIGEVVSALVNRQEMPLVYFNRG